MCRAAIQLIHQVVCKHAGPNPTERYQEQTRSWGIISTRPTRATLFAAAVLEVTERGCAHASTSHAVSVVRTRRSGV